MNGLASRNPFMRWVEWSLGTLLLAAGVLKLSQGPTFQPLRSGGNAVPWVEILLSLWLMSGIRSAWSLRVVVAVFFCFVMATLWMIAHGVYDCGCFGALSLSPKGTYWIDLLALFAAIGALRLTRFRNLFTAVLLPGITLYFIALAIAHHHHLSPRIEVGNPWPPTGAVDCSADLSKGRWVVLIYSSSCGHCQSLADDYAKDASEWTFLRKHGNKTMLALLDSDPSVDPNPSSSFPPVIRGELLQSDLYKHTPILLLLENGKILAVEESWEEADWRTSPHDEWIR